MEFFPLFLRLQGERCLVVGGGEVAARKTELLLKANAQVVVVAPETGTDISALEEQNSLRVLRRSFVTEDLDDCRIVIAATADGELNHRIADEAGERNILVNVVDDPDACSFIMPAILDRSPMVAAISSSGASPLLARALRARLESLIPASYGRLARLAGDFRDAVKTHLPAGPARRHFWEQVLEGPIAELVHGGREDEAREQLQHALANADDLATGEVYLVGAGPGDPDLLTFRALRLMQKADVVLHDRLVSPAVLQLVRRDAERIYVGKARACHALRQQEINALLVKLAREGKRALRLKGGDPFIFGRGGEEIETLAENGIPFQVVPGITAASGCAAYAGIPLTHRDHARSCVFVTGHLKDGNVNLAWDRLVARDQTLVFYMSLVGLPVIAEKLVEYGLPENTPAALIEQGTTPQQRVLEGTLATLPEIAVQAEARAPTLLIVGGVVKLRGQLRWFEGAD